MKPIRIVWLGQVNGGEDGAPGRVGMEDASDLPTHCLGMAKGAEMLFGSDGEADR